MPAKLKRKKEKKTWSDNLESGMLARVMLWKIQENGELSPCW
jgi:hypothetical protein